MWKVFGAVILLFAGLIGYYSYKDVVPFMSGSASERLESLWKRDIIQLTGAKQLPEAFYQIKEVEYKFGSQTAEGWIKGMHPPLVTKPNGNFKLDVFVDHWQEGKEYGAVIQYNLVSLADNNTVWEMGRTLKLGEREDLISQPEEVKTPTDTTQPPTSK